MSEVAIVTALVAGLFALLGSFFGAALTRRTEYEKWLRQARTEAFATLVFELHETRTQASVAFYDESEEEPDRSIKITAFFAALEKHVALARLFMSSSGREKLSTLISKLWLGYSSAGGPANHALQNKESMLQFQQLLEMELEYLPPHTYWPFALVKSLARRV